MIVRGSVLAVLVSDSSGLGFVQSPFVIFLDEYPRPFPVPSSGHRFKISTGSSQQCCVSAFAAVGGSSGGNETSSINASIRKLASRDFAAAASRVCIVPRRRR